MASPTQAPSRPTVPLAKGSWEDLHNQAIQLDRSRNADALPIYMKLVNRLKKMPEAQRMAHGERLQRILESAAIRSNEMFNSLERYDESLEVLSILTDLFPTQEFKDGATQAKLGVLMMAGRHDEALALVKSTPVEPDEPPLSRPVREFSINLDADRFAQANAALDRYAEIIEGSAYQATVTPQEIAHSKADLVSMRSILAMEERQWDQAIAFFEEATALSSDFSDDGYYLLYSNLIHRGEAERALPFVEKEGLQLRRCFWRGLALQHLGRTEEAATSWAEGLEAQASQDEAAAYVELVLIHYYLGDKIRVGLELFLRMLKEAQEPSWQLFFFTALGWGLHKNMRNALHNMDYAVDRARRNGQSRTVPWTMWLYIQDLIAEEDQAKFLPYFDAAEVEKHGVKTVNVPSQ